MTERWQHRRVRLPWGRMSVQIAGDGPPLLLLHGLGGSGRYWAGVAPLLAGSRTLIAPDLAGFGRSDKPRTDYTRDFHLDALERLLDALGAGPLAGIVGHSMGGILAALFAARHPTTTDALAMVAVPYPHSRAHPMRMPRGLVGHAVYRSMQRLVPLVSPLVRSPTYPRAVIADYLRHTVDSYQRTADALIWDPAAAAELASVDAALRGHRQLLLYSGEDTTIGTDSFERWRELLPTADVVVMPGAHQLLLRDHFATLATWLRGAG